MMYALNRSRVCVDLGGGVDSAVNDIAKLDNEIDIVEVDHGARFRRAGGDNLLEVAHWEHELRPVVYRLAEAGFGAYWSDGSVTRFVRFTHVPEFWQPVQDGTYEVAPSGLIYNVQGGETDDGGPQALIVVFSSMGGPYNKASLTRYFEWNFKSLSKHVPDRVAVLRIADLDGVVGGFYLPTCNYPRRDDDVADLIRSVAGRLGVGDDAVVLYGASKGATGALSQALKTGFRAVVVDPIVDDRLYVERFDDTHWTEGGVFLQPKQDYFASAIRAGGTLAASPENGRISLVSSTGSPWFESIETLAGQAVDAGRGIQFLVARDSRISDHPDVSPRTLRTVTGLLNMHVQGIEMPAGRAEIFC